MKKKKTKKGAGISTNRRNIIVGGVLVAALGALAFMVITLPGRNGGAQSNGYVFEMKGADLAIDKVVSKQEVIDGLGANAKGVEDVEKSGVLSFYGNKGQTATYNFTTTSGEHASLEVDVMTYQSQDAYDEAKVFAGTGSAGKVGNMEIRFLPAATLGYDREYALLVTKDLKSYKFSITQPSKKIEINELTAQDILKKLIAKARL